MIWLRRIAWGLGGLALLVVVVVYAGSEVVLRRAHAGALRPVPVPTAPAEVAEGARVALVASCRDCHGPDGNGRVLVDRFPIGRIAPPALANAIAGKSDAAVARAIRNGVSAHDGHGLVVMPVGALGHLSDQDVGRIIAWMRTLKPSPRDLADGGVHLGPLGRVAVLGGMLPVNAVPDRATPHIRPADIGRYWTESACSGCHALDHDRPTEDGKQVAPALASVGAAYDDAAFTRLLRTGKGMSPRDLGLMAQVARGSLAYLRDDEIAAIHDFLRAENGKLPRQ